MSKTRKKQEETEGVCGGVTGRVAESQDYIWALLIVKV